MNAFPQIAAGLLHQLEWGAVERDEWLHRNGAKLRYSDSDEMAAHTVPTFIQLDPWDRPPAGTYDTSWA